MFEPNFEFRAVNKRTLKLLQTSSQHYSLLLKFIFYYIHLVVSKTHRVSIKYIQVLKNFFPPRSDLQ